MMGENNGQIDVYFNLIYITILSVNMSNLESIARNTLIELEEDFNLEWKGCVLEE